MSVDIFNEAEEENEMTASERASRDREGGLEGWSYTSPFADVSISIDSADKILGELFVKEANAILENVKREVQSNNMFQNAITMTNWTRLDMLDVFLPPSILEKLRVNINRILSARKKASVAVLELKGVIILHVLAASYRSSVGTITDSRNREFFYQIGLSGERYNEVWSALSCSTDRRERVETSIGSWSNKPTRGNNLITELEQELAAVNRALFYVPGVTIFSLDDDHQGLRSRAVAEYTNLSHINNQKKALGPVNNALCSALNPVCLASHYSRTGEQVIHVWEHLVQLVQGVPTSGSLRPMTDAIFAADRGYNTKQTINFLNDRLARRPSLLHHGATGLGTHKRSLDYPFVFGDGPVRKRHKGMVVSDKGSRAIYSASRRKSGGLGRKVEAAVYRENVSGRIASMYHNDTRLFGRISLSSFLELLFAV